MNGSLIELNRCILRTCFGSMFFCNVKSYEQCFKQYTVRCAVVWRQGDGAITKTLACARLSVERFIWIDKFQALGFGEINE
jgi:hypothetical protein